MASWRRARSPRSPRHAKSCPTSTGSAPRCATPAVWWSTSRTRSTRSPSPPGPRSSSISARRNARQRMIETFSPGAFGHAIWPGLEVLPQDLKVQKRRFGAFAPGASDLHAILQAARHRHADRHRHRDAGVLRVHRARRDDAELQGVLHRRRQRDVQRRRTQRDAVGDGARVLRCDRHRHDGRNDRTRRRRRPRGMA